MFNGTRHFHNAIQPLCARALDLDAGAREAWLEELRADCPTVARALERLIKPALASCQGNRAMRATSPVVPGSPEYLGLRW